jgi:PPOX class probable F420-dependent enzyme
MESVAAQCHEGRRDLACERSEKRCRLLDPEAAVRGLIHGQDATTGRIVRPVIDRLSDQALELLNSDAVAIVVTLDAEGTPHVSSAWIGVDAGEILIGTLDDQRKLQNLRRDPRIALTIQSDHINEWGLREYLVLNGTARITEGGAAALLQRLAHTYIGPDAVFPATPNPPPGFVTHVTIERVSGIGPWRRSH